ncbi:MAG TPA: MaoC/PaaZ C-terminal domain-containing protein [Pseudonocardiaceae bacterium]|jgi:acyl dehydratase|nr:MaoC/PaaZ C-terminal domain-containing protein [Pseudonocardiaceae bacterium]
METVELDRDPNLAVLFGKAALGSLRRSGGEPVLPATGFARTDVRVDREHLAAYDRVCGFRLSDELPIPYPHLLVFGMQVALMTGDEFPFPMIGLVHVANRITQTRPLRADEPLVLRAHATNLRPHERGTQFDMVSQVLADGAPVWRETSTYLRRTTASSADRTTVAPAEKPAAVWRIPDDAGRRYADVSGDHNPIHLHPLTARAFGFRRAIAHGMWSMARCLAFFEGRLPAAYTVDVRFKLPILLPATVALTVTDDHFDLRDRRTGKPHLAGLLTPA